MVISDNIFEIKEEQQFEKFIRNFQNIKPPDLSNEETNVWQWAVSDISLAKA